MLYLLRLRNLYSFITFACLNHAISHEAVEVIISSRDSKKYYYLIFAFCKTSFDTQVSKYGQALKKFYENKSSTLVCFILEKRLASCQYQHRYWLLFSGTLLSKFYLSDYANSRCQSYDLDTNSRTGRKRLEKDSIVNFFEKICLRGGKLQPKTRS